MIPRIGGMGVVAKPQAASPRFALLGIVATRSRVRDVAKRVESRDASGPRGGAGQHANLDIDSRGQTQTLVQRLDRLACRLQNVDQTLVGPNFELLARLAIDVWTAQHRVTLDARRQWNRSVHRCPGLFRGADNLLRRAVQHFVIVSLHPDADPFACTRCQRRLLARSVFPRTMKTLG